MKKNLLLERITLVILLAVTIVQLGKHLWPEYALLYGSRIDYLSPTIYLFDLVAIFSLLINKKALAANLNILRPLTLILLLNTLTSLAPQITLVYSLRLLLYAAVVVSLPLKKYRKLSTNTILTMMLAVVLLAALQVTKESNIGGVLYWLGERNLSLSLPAVAKTQIGGKVLLRAYATFSHPNILAGWLTIFFFILSTLSPNKSKITGGYALAILGSLLAQSRLAIVALALWGISRNHKNSIPLLTLVAIVLIINSGSWDRSLAQRLELQRTSGLIIRTYPLFGSGFNASIPQYPGVNPSLRLLQPDHNTATLLLSQGGLFLLLALIGMISSPIKLKSSPEIYLVLLLALADHYLVTNPQGIFALLLLWRTRHV